MQRSERAEPAGTATAPDAIVAISSHVARGTVGNRAAAHAIEALGHPVWSVPTILLPWHPGQGAGTRAAWPGDAFTSLLDDLSRSKHLREVGAVLSGYLGAAEQAGAIASLVRAAKEERDVIYCCDPVIGNARGRYVPEPIALAIRDVLVPLADIITPNRFELSWLAGETVPDDLGRVATLAGRLGPPTVLVTSVRLNETMLTTMLVHADEAFIATHDRIDAPNSGTGDLTAALFLARTLEGEAPVDALRLAVAGAAEAVAAERELGADELPLERIHDRLRAPNIAVSVEAIG